MESEAFLLLLGGRALSMRFLPVVFVCEEDRHVFAFNIAAFLLSGGSGSERVKHWVRGGCHHYHNVRTREGGWDEPTEFVQNDTQLSREEMQVKYVLFSSEVEGAPISGLIATFRSNVSPQ